MKKHIVSCVALLLLVTLCFTAIYAQQLNPKSKRIQPTMNSLIEIQKTGNYSCVISNGDITRSFNQKGVADLYDLLQREPALLNGAMMVDKVVGKGAAALMIAGGVRKVHTNIICTPAIEMLKQAGVEVTFNTEVEYIHNMSKTDWCPLEKLCKDIPTAQECMPVIDGFVKDMRSGKK